MQLSFLQRTYDHFVRALPYEEMFFSSMWAPHMDTTLFFLHLIVAPFSDNRCSSGSLHTRCEVLMSVPKYFFREIT